MCSVRAEELQLETHRVETHRVVTLVVQRRTGYFGRPEGVAQPIANRYREARLFLADGAVVLNGSLRAKMGSSLF
jgi:hypothetical protein